MPQNRQQILHPFFERSANPNLPSSTQLSTDDIVQTPPKPSSEVNIENQHKQSPGYESEDKIKHDGGTSAESLHLESSDGTVGAISSHHEQAADRVRKRQKLSSSGLDTVVTRTEEPLTLASGSIVPYDETSGLHQDAYKRSSGVVAKSQEDPKASSGNAAPKINSFFGPLCLRRPSAEQSSANKSELDPRTGEKRPLQPDLPSSSLPPLANVEREDENLVGKDLKRRKRHDKSRLVILRYGQTDERHRACLGRKIDDINATGIPEDRVQPVQIPSQSTPKPMHPFFSGNDLQQNQKRRPHEPDGAPADPPSSSKTRHTESTLSFSTPGKMIYHAHRRLEDRSREVQDQYQPHLGTVYRIPGTTEPPWPSKGIASVGRLHDPYLFETPNSTNSKKGLKRKSKFNEVPQNENLIHQFASKLFSSLEASPCDERNRAQENPARLVMSGKDLKARTLEILHISPGEEHTLVHPRLVGLVGEIENSMSPFDSGECENIPWTMKHAPKSTADVLQDEREMRALRDWLKGQMVTGANNGNVRSKSPPEDRSKHRKKRPKHNNDLDGFIVDGDEDAVSMRDLHEEEVNAADLHEGILRSVVADRTDADVGGKLQRTANAVLLSGPHGCGKTAAVFAAAKELGFEIFEIGPGSRRSAKDILEKVGDMALNHQVSKSDVSPDADSDNAIELPPPKAPEDQPTLGSFFARSVKPKTSSKAKPKHSAAIPGKKSKAPSRLKQSLILLEEVDVIFEQDKQFWETVIELAMHSKRPIVMTCTEERLIPLMELSLHAILRLRPPEETLAVKYLLLLAAVEGHILQYETAANIYRMRESDLRASIADLDFWCQMAVGDRKGGMEWHLERWPLDVDRDEYGRKLRVVSENTMVPGLGFLGQIPLAGEESPLPREDILSEAWMEWNLEPSHISHAALSSLATDAREKTEDSTAKRRLAALCEYESLSSLISATDTTSIIGPYRLPLNNEALDATGPPMPDSEKANFTEGHSLLQTDTLMDYSQLGAKLAIYVHLAIEEMITQTSRFAGSNPASNVGPKSWYDRVLTSVLHRGKRAKFLRDPPFQHESLLVPFDFLREEWQPSSFDQNASTVARDVAPYIRSIAAYDINLERQKGLSPASSDGQHIERSSRKTRASRSAMEGSRRDVTRRERWFDRSTLRDLEAVLRSGYSAPLRGPEEVLG